MNIILFCVLILRSISAVKFAENCQIVYLPLLHLSLRDKTLENFVYETNIQLDKTFCLIRCLAQRKCKSVNYNTDTSVCQLNSEDHNTQPASLTASTDSTQYFSIDGIDENILGRCAGHTCADDLVREPHPYGLSAPYQCVVFVVCVPTDGCTNCMQSKYSISAAEFAENCKIVNLPLLQLSLRDKRLENFVYETNIQPDKTFCLIRCLEQRKCKSVNYIKDTSYCQLNSEDHNTESASLTASTDSTQYYGIDGIDEVR
ncbi:Hypothetical predicted protein [Mytilus galloprovincialis]|uniref:Apple domain-containing protein n=1 Tax=Mytilus galloprovincialis TaxID=29158 RepID=A0A8B6FSL0_MYTGA|nr:Hypothetical predicted protein [Mytilus galloprovincialis]